MGAASHLLFTACYRAEKDNKAGTELLDGSSSKVDANEAYLHFSSKDLGLDLDSLSSKNDDDDLDNWEDVTPGSKKETRSSWMDARSSLYAKEKLVRIRAGDLSIPGQRWSFRRILATLVYHQKDQQLCVAF